MKLVWERDCVELGVNIEIFEGLVEDEDWEQSIEVVVISNIQVQVDEDVVEQDVKFEDEKCSDLGFEGEFNCF